jgi:hypothetical protein
MANESKPRGGGFQELAVSESPRAEDKSGVSPPRASQHCLSCWYVVGRLSAGHGISETLSVPDRLSPVLFCVAGWDSDPLALASWPRLGGEPP